MTNFPLKYPFEFRGTKYEAINVRRPKVRDVRKFIKGLEGDAVLAIEKAIADLAELEPEIIAEIDIEDFGPIKDWFEGFLKPMGSGSTE